MDSTSVDSVSVKEKEKTKRTVFIIIGIVAIIALPILCCLGFTIFANLTDDGASTSSSSDTANDAGPAEVVDLAAFVQEFDDNEIAATTKYSKKKIETSGYINSISESFSGEPYATLKPTTEEFYLGTQIQCYFDDKNDLTSVKVGDQRTFVGVVDSELLGQVILKDCSIK